jgi:hypothetical protein
MANPPPLISRYTASRIGNAVAHRWAPVWFAVYSRTIPRSDYMTYWWLSREDAHRDIAMRRFKPDYLIKVTPIRRTTP